MNNVTRSTGVHTFHITGMPTTLYIYVPLHFYCSLHTDPNYCKYPLEIKICDMPKCRSHITAHISRKMQLIYHAITIHVSGTNLLIICHISISNKYVLQRTKICYMPQLLNVHLWWKYANIHAKYEVASITDVAIIAIHRRRRQYHSPV